MRVKIRKIFREPRLTDAQLRVIADIFLFLGQLSFSSLALPFLIPQLDVNKMWMIVLGILASAVFWLLAIRVMRRVKS